MILKGHSNPINVNQVDLGTDKKSVYMVLTFMVGSWADVDSGSEVLRCIGRARFEVYGAYSFMRHRVYNVKMSWTND